MKIAMIGHKRVPSRDGGIEVVVGKLTEVLTSMGYDVDVYNRYSGGQKVREYCGAKVIEVPTFKSSKLNAMVYSFFATVWASFSHADVIHFHAEGPCAMIPIARLFHKRCVATIHGLDWQRSKWGGFASKYIKFGEKQAAKHAHEVIVLSPATQKYFKEVYGRDTAFIPNGIEKAQLPEPQIIKDELGLDKNSYILFLARLTPEKGLHYLLEAFKNIKTDKKLVIAGGLEPSTEYIEQIKQMAAQDDRVVLAGFVSGKKLDELFTNCELYVLPSDVEGMPLSLLEAIGHKARCLVSDIDENVGVASDYLHTFEKSNVKSLEEKLSYILSHSGDRPINYGKTQTVEETDRVLSATIARYDWNSIVNETVCLYQNNAHGVK